MTQTPPGRTFMRLAFAGIAAYVVYVLAGKAAQLANAPLPMQLGDTGEFLLVLATMVCFVAGLLARERAGMRAAGSQPEEE